MGATTASSGAAGPDRRIVVSGVGAVSGFGWGIEPLWEGLRAGRTAIRDFRRFDHSAHRTHLAAEVPEPFPAPAGRQLSLADRFALFAAAEALAGAGFRVPSAEHPVSFPEDAEVGVYFGSSTGGMWESELYFSALRSRDTAGSRRAHLRHLASQQVNGPGDAVARHLGVTGPVQTISSACASGGLALGAALAALRAGEVDLAISGGSDSLCQLTYAGFNALRSVDERPCRPFRRDRLGMSFGEGAAVLVLEPLDRVLGRGAEPLAELAGAGAACDAHHMTAPEPMGRGAAAALAAALADSGVTADRIAFVNAHATGTPLNDAAEWNAFRSVFGERAERIPVTASKAGLGHLLGSAGAIEAVITVLSLARGELHPTPASGEVSGDPALDPEIPVALVVDRPQRLAGGDAGASTSLAFGGSNAALVFTRWAGLPA